MDYLCVGSNGYAQVGQPDFHMKNKAEMAVLLEYLEKEHPVPDEFSGICCYKVKWFRHDFGDYSEIVLVFNDRLLQQWEENDPEISDRFWNWFNQVESIDLESEAITEQIESCYHKLIDDSEPIPVTHESESM